MRIGYVLDKWQELSQTFIANEVEAQPWRALKRRCVLLIT